MARDFTTHSVLAGMQQVGGAVGASGLSTIFASAVSSYLHTHASSPRLISSAAVHDYTTAFWVAAAIFAAGAILIGSLVPSIKARPTTPKPTPARAQPRPRAPLQTSSAAWVHAAHRSRRRGRHR
jgi:hypothetical protein